MTQDIKNTIIITFFSIGNNRSLFILCKIILYIIKFKYVNQY